MQSPGAGLLSALLCLSLAAGEEKPSPWDRYPLMKASKKAVFVHVMVSFTSKDFSGRWRGWNYSNSRVKHDPEKRNPDGRPDIASIYYPRIGTYDMTDPDYVEYHCQLVKMTGLDGMMFDLPFGSGEEWSWGRKSMRLYVEYMKRYGLEAVVIYEDKARWLWDRKTHTRQEAVAACYRDLDAWLALFAPVNYRIGERPLLAFFSYYNQKTPDKGTAALSPEELKAWLSRFPPRRRPVLVCQWYRPEYYGVHDGKYDWPELRGKPPAGSPYRIYTTFETVKATRARGERLVEERFRKGEERYHVGGVWPGFDDRGCWGWGDGPRFIPRLDGEVYRYLWERAIACGYPVVQIASWNDWFEGHNIEPSVEFGYQYLEMTRQYAARFKGLPAPRGELRLAEWIYKIRKCTRSSSALAAAQRASLYILKGKYERAERSLRTWVKRLRLDRVKYWTLNGPRPSRPAR